MANPDTLVLCRHCAAFRAVVRRDHSDWGECRRRAPILPADPECDLTWPLVRPGDWCCEAIPLQSALRVEGGDT